MRIPANVYEDLARESERAARDLGLRFGGVTRLAGALRFDNMIGTIATPHAALELVPKTSPGQNWLQSVLDLIDDRPVVVSDRAPASDSPDVRFLELIARTYSSRLSDALALEGPITTIETTFSRTPMLSGRLRVGDWVSRAAYDGHRFPVDHQVLSIDNSYAQTLAYVGQALAPAIREAAVRRQLLENVDTLAGSREIHDAPANAVGLDLPVQWGAYEPAWIIAQMILRQRSRFGHKPQPYGMSLAIEPWILLERLLERALVRLAERLSKNGVNYKSRPQRGVTFLVGSTPDETSRRLTPDCVLLRDDKPIVNFEAKYRDYGSTGSPLRNESYQAITAGRALDTSIAVLVYPNPLPGTWFAIRAAGHSPEHLAVIGLDLFGYRKGVGEEKLADQLLSLLENIPGTAILSPQGAAA